MNTAAIFAPVLKYIEKNSAHLAAVCRRLDLDVSKVLLMLRVLAGLEPMPVASVVAPWEREGWDT